MSGGSRSAATTNANTVTMTRAGYDRAVVFWASSTAVLVAMLLVHIADEDDGVEKTGGLARDDYVAGASEGSSCKKKKKKKMMNENTTMPKA